MKKVSILVVDDEQGIRDLFKFMLEPEGFKIDTAEDGEKGLELYEKGKYDIVFLDVHMPKMRGPEALKKIKKINPGQEVVVFSSSSDPEFIFEKQAEKAGAAKCIYKPFTVDEVLKIVNNIMEGKDGG